MVNAGLDGALARLLPRKARRAVARHARRLFSRPSIGGVNLGDLRRLTPICRDWGFSRGTPIDRHYIHEFMARHAADVRGRVLEIGTPELTQLYGGGRVRTSAVLHVADPTPPTTVVGDLISGAGLESNAFDCAIVTQTLQFIYDNHSVVRTLHRILAPGGVALITVPAITKLSPEDMDRWGQYWSFTSRSIRTLFEEAFSSQDVTVEAAGNVLAATAFLHGISAEELSGDELAHIDVEYEVLLGVRARKLPA